MYVSFEFHMQKLQGFKILAMKDIIRTWKYDVNVVNILKICRMYL